MHLGNLTLLGKEILGHDEFSQLAYPHRDGLLQPHTSPNSSPVVSPSGDPNFDGEDKMELDNDAGRSSTPINLTRVFPIAPENISGMDAEPWLEAIGKVERRWNLDRRCVWVECAEALTLCAAKKGEAKVTEFIRDILYHILDICLTQNWKTVADHQQYFRQIFKHASLFVIEWLKDQQTAILPCLRLLSDSKHQLYTSGGRQLFHDTAVLLCRAANDVVMALSLHEVFFAKICSNIKDFELLLRCCTLTANDTCEDQNSFFDGWAEHVIRQIADLTVDSVVAVLTDPRNKQISIDGMERLLKAVEDNSQRRLEDVHETWRKLAVDCTHSQKLIVRKAGLEIFTALAKVIPEKAGKWLMENGESSVLAGLTGERAHENLVDLLRAFMYHRERSREGPVEPEFLDRVLSTCLGTTQHPTKDVRDAFRCALAKFVLSLPEYEARTEKQMSLHRIQVSRYVLECLLKELSAGTEGTVQLTLSVLKEWDYDPVSMCSPSPRYLVDRHIVEQDFLADLTIRLLWAAFMSTALAGNFEDLVRSLAICLQHGPSVGRPGTRKAIAKDMDLLVSLCKGCIADSENMMEHQRTVACKVLLQLLFFHLRSDGVQSVSKWSHSGYDNPKNMDWAKEGKVPMLAMRRAEWIYQIEHRYQIINAIVDECCTLEQQAKALGKVDSEDHKSARWIRLELLRFLHVEADDNTLPVNYEILEQLWAQLPVEVCCKWLRVLADSGEALNEEVTETAFKKLVCGVDLPRLGKHGFNCFEAVFGEINSRLTPEHRRGRMVISGRQVVHKGIKVSGQNLLRRRVSWFCCTQLRRNVGTITAFDDSPARQDVPFDFENDDLFDGKKKSNRLVPLEKLFDCHILEDNLSPEDIRAFEIESITIEKDQKFGCNLIGMDELWRVVLEALDDGVAARARDMLLSLSRKLPDRFLRDFLDTVFEEIRILDGEGQSPMQVEGERSPMCEDSEPMLVEKGSDCQRLLPPEDLRTSRALSLLQTFLDAHILECVSLDVLPHVCCIRGEEVQLTIIQRSKSRARNPSDQHKGGESCSGLDNFEEYLHSKMTLRELQDCAAKYFRMNSGENVQLSLGGQVLAGRGKTLEELKIIDRSILYLETIDDSSYGQSHGHLTVLHLISRDSEETVSKRYLSLLTRLEQEERRPGHSALQQQIWSVLASLPTAPFLLEALKESNGCVKDWAAFFGVSIGVWKSIYQLQIIDSILLPRSQPAEGDSTWRENFVLHGGVNELCTFLFTFCSKQASWCSPSHLSWQIGVPIILRLLKFLLHGSFKALAGRLSSWTSRQSSLENLEAPTQPNKDLTLALDLDPVSPRLKCDFTEDSARRVLQADISGVLQHLVDATIVVSVHVTDSGSPCRPALLDNMILLNMIIRRLNCLQLDQRSRIVDCLFTPKPGFNGCEALIRSLLMASTDADVRQSSMSFLLHAVMIGAVPDTVFQVPSDMARMTAELIVSSLAAAVESKENGECQPIIGSHFFDWASRVVNLRICGNHLLQVEENRYLLIQCLSLITRGTTCVALDSKRPLPTLSIAAGCLKLVLHLLERLPSSVWSPVCRQLSLQTCLIDQYLLAEDPAGAPLLGWPDDICNADSRKAGWDVLLRICDGSDESSLDLLAGTLDRVTQFITKLPQPVRKTESGPEELFTFDPEHNGLRHGKSLVGLKNRRNTCYMNSMLQQLYFTPQFCRWLSLSRGNEPATPAMPLPGPAETELSVALHRLLAALTFSQTRFYDPAEFIRACKEVKRSPPLLDAAHTQDDTMTFLEGIIETLGTVHGAAPSDMFKIVEKERRKLHGTEEPRNIKGNEREYLMLEIEEGIGTLTNALDKHFSQELMSGDNRIWNEVLQRKETVWKTPFIEEESLPQVQSRALCVALAGLMQLFWIKFSQTSRCLSGTDLCVGDSGACSAVETFQA
jgi:hypothetical protein